MKTKSKTLRLAAMLLVAVLITACFVGGTMAKYVTAVNGAKDSARVARWFDGATLKIDLFKDSYGTTVQALNADGTASEDKIIAPGTENSYQFILETAAGPVEVAYDMSITVDMAASKYSDAWGTYDPLAFTLIKPDGTKVVDGGSFADLKTGLNGITTTVNPGDASTGVYTIEWEWPFAGDDAKDTDLGQRAVTSDISLDLVVDITATQVD